MIKLNHAPQPYSAVALGKVHRPRILAPAVAVAVIAFSGSALSDTPPSSIAAPYSQQFFPDPTGVIATVNVNGPVKQSGTFFQSLGTNGRTCATCHVSTQSQRRCIGRFL